MKMPLNPNPLEARQPGSGVAPTQGARRATGVGATAGDRQKRHTPCVPRRSRMSLSAETAR